MNRNDKCSCGSGLKYKKCCMLKQHEDEIKEREDYDAWLKEQDRIGQENLKAMRDKNRICKCDCHVVG